MMVQFATLGTLLAKYVYKIDNARVALVNIGEEEEKGNILTQATFPLLKNAANLNFVGNVESRHIFDDVADVMVSDGFTGNMIIKLSESFYEIAHNKGIKDEFFERFNYEQYGGSPILGVNGSVVVGHGISNPEAIKNMVLLSKTVFESGLIGEITQAFQ
jgi:glycerol-3-phosphate acyltransferase PlsX